MISSLIHYLFRSVLFHFHRFVDFSDFFCYWLLFDSTKVRECILHDFNSLNLLKLVLSPILENVPCALEKNVFCSCWVNCSININSVKCVSCVVQTFSDFFPACSTSYWESCIKIAHYNWRLVCSSFYLSQILLFTCWGSGVSYIPI